MGSVLKIALPVILSFLGSMLLMTVDLIFVGKLGALPIAAVGLGGATHAGFFVFGLGLLTGLEFLTAREVGAGKPDQSFNYWIQGVWVALVLSVVLILGQNLAALGYRAFGVAPELVVPTQEYVFWISFSTLPSLLLILGRIYLQAHSRVIAPLVVSLIANVLNYFLNKIWVEGAWGFQSLGLIGSAYATTVARVLSAILLMGWVAVFERRRLRASGRSATWKLRMPDFPMWREILILGIPSGFQMGLEVGVFALGTALAGKISTVALAAHQIVLNVASLTFMVPLGLGSAGAVLVGHQIGRRDFALARRQGYRIVGLAVGFMAMSAVFLSVFSGWVFGIFTTDFSVIQLGRKLIFLAAIFQLSDGIQVSTTGTLRGIGDTRSSMWANMAGHWVFGIPLGSYLAFSLGQGVEGLWVGFVAGLTLVAITLIIQWDRKSRVSALKLSGG
ncbi:MAG: MATE family efflux transporter [Bdellovibrionales bacterium]|nr:MATE family efflux transporter [Bdellovibrionales bacterium]